MVETTTIIEGEGAAELPDLISSQYPHSRMRRYESMRIIVFEHVPRWYGCSSVTSVTFNIIDGNSCRLYILHGGEWFPFARRSSTKRYRGMGSEIFRRIQEVCDKKGWEMGDIVIAT